MTGVCFGSVDVYEYMYEGDVIVFHASRHSVHTGIMISYQSAFMTVTLTYLVWSTNH